MRNNFVRTLALVGMVGMMSSTGLVAHAAEAPATAQTQPVKQQLNSTVIAKVFDAKYYAETYPDVVEVLGADPAVLLSHYINSGIYEGRDASKDFNATFYMLANKDLSDAFGDNLEGLLEHYVTFGSTEGRIASVENYVNADPAKRAAVSQSISSTYASAANKLKLDGIDLSSIDLNTLSLHDQVEYGLVNFGGLSFSDKVNYYLESSDPNLDVATEHGSTIRDELLSAATLNSSDAGYYYNPVTKEKMQWGVFEISEPSGKYGMQTIKGFDAYGNYVDAILATDEQMAQAKADMEKQNAEIAAAREAGTYVQPVTVVENPTIDVNDGTWF